MSQVNILQILEEKYTVYIHDIDIDKSACTSDIEHILNGYGK